MLVSTAIAAAYLIWEPSSADLAAQTFRADLFADRGFVLWSEAWYGGFHVPGYSLLYPPLAAWLGVRLVGALAAVAAAATFAALASRRYGPRATVASLWFAVGVSAWLFTGRMSFLLGISLGLGALLAADSYRPFVAGFGCVFLAFLAALASPVAGLFTAIAGLAIGLAGDRARGARLVLPPVLAIVVLVVAFPTGGEEPFVLSSFLAVPVAALIALWVIPPEERELRIGVIVYALLAILVVAIPNPLGGNIGRLGALFAGPVAILVVWRRPIVLVALAVPLLYWQFTAPVRDTVTAVDDASTERSFYAPLLSQLAAQLAGRPAHPERPVRIHVPPTRNRWEAVYVAERFPLARGWMRQLESDDFELFDDGNLTPSAYRHWLAEHGVSYVAVPNGVKRDYLAEDEVELIERGLPYLDLDWKSDDWRLYEVAGNAPLRLRWTPYWEIVAGDGCVERDGDWTRIDARPGAELRIQPRFDPEAVLGRDRVCSA